MLFTRIIVLILRSRKSADAQMKSQESDEDVYSKGHEPDKEDDSYYYDEVDQFHMEQDKVSTVSDLN